MKINGRLSNDEIEELILNYGLSDKRVEDAYYRIARKRANIKDAEQKAWAKANGLKYP